MLYIQGNYVENQNESFKIFLSQLYNSTNTKKETSPKTIVINNIKAKKITPKSVGKNKNKIEENIVMSRNDTQQPIQDNLRNEKLIYDKVRSAVYSMKAMFVR